MIRKVVKFSDPFLLEAIDRMRPAGNYEFATDEELIEGLSLPVYRRIGTTMLVPASSYRGAFEMLTIDPLNLEAAQDGDAAAAPNKADCLSAKVQ